MIRYRSGDVLHYRPRVLERLTGVQVANLGGTVPFLVERMDEVSRSGGSELPSERMRRCYVDTASFGPRAIELAAACFGADRLLFGTDCPIFATDRALGALAEARLDERSRELILAGNARRLLARGLMNAV